MDSLSFSVGFFLCPMDKSEKTFPLHNNFLPPSRLEPETFRIACEHTNRSTICAGKKDRRDPTCTDALHYVIQRALMQKCRTSTLYRKISTVGISDSHDSQQFGSSILTLLIPSVRGRALVK